MIRKTLRVALVVFVAAALLYISRFWPVELWGRQSWLNQILGLRPGGDMLVRWLRPIGLAEFTLLIWAGIAFLALSLTEAVCQRWLK